MPRCQHYDQRQVAFELSILEHESLIVQHAHLVDEEQT